MQDRVIVGIHGLARKPPREEKAAWWQAAALEGLRRNCGSTRGSLPLDFVYWADIRHAEPLDEAHNLEPYHEAPGTGPLPAFADAADTSEEEKRRLSLGDRLYRAVEWIQERTGLTPVDDALIEHRLDDLWGYLEDADFRAEARGRLREAVERHAGVPLFIAAHSMGSLIAYDVLRIMEREGAGPRVDHFVTMGAPLGLAEVRMKMEEEHGDLIVPPCVRRWSNLVDREDVAGYGQDVGDAYRPGASGVRARDVPVINAYRRPGDGRRNRHKSYGYLRTPEFSRALHDFLEGRERRGAAEHAGPPANEPGINAIACGPAEPV